MEGLTVVLLVLGALRLYRKLDREDVGELGAETISATSHLLLVVVVIRRGQQLAYQLKLIEFFATYQRSSRARTHYAPCEFQWGHPCRYSTQRSRY